MGYPYSRATAETQFMFNQVSRIEYFPKTNRIENILSFLYVILLPRGERGGVVLGVWRPQRTKNKMDRCLGDCREGAVKI